MNNKQFIEKYCYNCGTQRCEGIGTEWFDGCHYKLEHDSFKTAEAPDMEEAQEESAESRSLIIRFLRTSLEPISPPTTL